MSWSDADRIDLEEPTAIDATAVAGTPSLLRAINERTVLECVRRVGPISRAQLARETALSKPTA